MKANRWRFSLATALLLGATSCVEFVQLRAMAFGIGESESPVVGQSITPAGELVRFISAGWLLISALGILGLGIAAFGSLTGRRAFAHVGLVGGLLALPMAIFLGWNGIYGDIVNSRVITIGAEQWMFEAVPLPLTLVAIWLCWLRIRNHATQALRDER